MNHETLPAQGPVDVNVRGEFDAILRELGPTTLADVIDIAIARCAVKKGRRASARRLIETAFDVARETETPNVEVKGRCAASSRSVPCNDGLGVAVPPAPTFEGERDER